MRHHHPTRRRLLVALALVAGAAGGPWAPLAGIAHAADQPKGKGGEAPSVPQSAASSGSQAGTTATSRASGGSDDDVGGIMDHAPGTSGKWFDLGATWETHGLLWKFTDNATRKLFNFVYLYASLNITRNDRIRVRGGFYEYLLADPGESGVRATDISVSYSHIFRLPSDFNLRGTVAATIPTAFASYKSGLYTAPTGSISLSKAFDFGLAADVNVFGGGYLQNSTSSGGYDINAQGGAPNARAVFGGSIEIDYAFWFHKPLVIGVDFYNAWLWFQNQGPIVLNTDGSAFGGAKNIGGTTDNVYKNQPVQQVYGYEVFLLYSFPTFAKIHVDLRAAVGEGDPTLGYPSRNIDGIAYFLGNYRQNFQAYGSLSLRY